MKTFTMNTRILQICTATLLLIAMAIPCHAFDLDNLTSVGKPALAFSVRKLTSTYNGPALTVRSGDNNVVVDVYFDTNNIVSLSSPVSADGGGAATSKTLGTWIGSNTAFVTKWYDQSGNGRNAVTAGTKCKTLPGTLTSLISSSGLTLSTPIAVKKYTITTIDAVNNQDSITIATIPTVSIGVTGGSAGTLVTSAYPSASNKWQNFNNILVGNGIPDGTMMMGTTQVPTTVTGNVKVRLSNPVTLAAGATITMYDNVCTNQITNYQPGNVIVSKDGFYIGTIQNIGDDGKSIILSNNAIIGGTFTANTWGVSNEPMLVKQGSLQTLANGMTAIRFVNGGVSGSGFVVPNFTNDTIIGSNANLQKVKNMSLFVAAQQKGNAGNTNFWFGTSAPTSATPGKLQVYIASTATSNGAYSTQAGGSAAFAAGTQILARYKLLGDSVTIFAPIGSLTSSNRGKKGFFSTTTTPPVVTPFDNTQLQIFGHSGNVTRNFEGLASELIYWGSTITTAGEMSDADAAIILTSQKEVYGVKEFASAVSSVSDLPIKVYPTIGKGVFNIEGECIGATYAVVNLMGQIIKNGKIQQTSQVINLTESASGTYFIKLSLNNRMVVKKIVKL